MTDSDNDDVPESLVGVHHMEQGYYYLMFCCIHFVSHILVQVLLFSLRFPSIKSILGYYLNS